MQHELPSSPAAANAEPSADSGTAVKNGKHRRRAAP